MRAAASTDEFMRAPTGRYLVGGNFLAWCWSETLCGATCWGRFGEQDVGELVRLHDVGMGLAPQFDVFIDGRAIEAVDPPVYLAFLAGLEVVLPKLVRRVRRQALLAGAGLVGSAIAGHFLVAGWGGPSYRVFHDRAAAVAWLERDDMATAFAEVEKLVAGARPLAPLVRGLRGHLAGELAGATLAAAARALGVSERTLQRQLGEAGTSFRAELTAVRIAAARALLVDSDAKLAVIARQVGAASVSHFATSFRRVTGESPGQYRARRRG